MTVNDVVDFVEGSRSHWYAGLVVLLYYGALYWPRIRASLKTKPTRSDVESAKLVFEIAKLEYEIAVLKTSADLDQNTVNSIDGHLQERLGSLKEPSYKTRLTPLQKYAGIPILLATLAIGASELFLWSDDSADTLAGTAVLMIFEVVVFWGYPALKRHSASAGRWAAVLLWGGLFFFVASVVIDLIDSLTGSNSTEEYGGVLMLLSFGLAIALGHYGILPGTQRHKE